ncbi:hypothetical protein ACFXTN_007339 [Malus domestica]
MRLSSKQSTVSNRSGPRLRKKHKRLDAICEQEYKRNHNGGVGPGPGRSGSGEVELRRSGRARRAPILLDVSPSPPKKRRKVDKNVVVGAGMSVKEEDLETPGSWRSRLRSRGRNVGFGVKGKRKLYEEVSECRREEKMVGTRSNDKNGEFESGRHRVVKSKGPGRIRATNSSDHELREELPANKDEPVEEEAEVINKNEDVAMQLDSGMDGGKEMEIVDDDSTMITEAGENSKLEEACIVNEHVATMDNAEVMEHADDLVATVDNVDTMEHANELVATVDNVETMEHADEHVEAMDNVEPTEHADEKVEQSECVIQEENNDKHVKQLECVKEGENQGDARVSEAVRVSRNEVEVAGCHEGKDSYSSKPDEELAIEMNNAKVDKFKHRKSDTLGKPHIKEGRRCGLCGGGTDGKPPKRLVHDTGESENEAYCGSSASEELNYNLWDGFGDEPGWLGRLLGPVNDRYGIAGIWVHQNCAVWSPEVYFAGLGCLKNVRAALCRGRALKCTRCGRAGATIGCRVDRCPRTYHLPCARAYGCVFDHRKFLIACTDHRNLFQPLGDQYLARIKKLKAKKMKMETRKLSNDALRKDIEAEEKWLENCGEDEEFLKRESKRLHRDLVRIAPVYIGGSDSESGKLFQGWESVAGLQDVIGCMKEVVMLPLLYPEFFDSLGLTPPRGVLLHGYPGTGKTLVVRALIGACARGDKRIAYFARKGADCLGKYVGDSERQLRLLFQVAEKCQPSIIFFDEIDGLAPSRTRQQDQTHSSVVSTLLALMDGLKSRGSVVVIGATNRPDAVDPALRRPGRFDREIYFPLPSVEDRAAILSLHTQKWPKPVAGSILKLVASRTAGFAGADLQALCTQAAIISLKRNFPLQEVLSTAGKNASDHRRLSLPAFAVEDRDWLEALSCSPPPCSRREAGVAANDVVCSPLPTHLIPCLLQPLSTMLVSLYLDERLWLPAPLRKSARMIESVMVSALNKKKMPSDRWWSHISVLLQEADVAKDIERKLLRTGILLGYDTCADSDVFNDDHDDDDSLKFQPSVKHHGGTRPSLLRNISVTSTSKSGFRILIAGNPRAGQRHLASCLLHCFVGNVQVQKVDLATVLQEGHGDMVQGITKILMKCASVGSSIVFMPRIDLWAVETLLPMTEESDSDLSNHLLTENEKSYSVHGQAVEEGSEPTSQQCKSIEMGECTGVSQGASHAWNLFVEQVESICVSSSLMILATSEVPYSVLPVRIRQFFKSDISNCNQSIPMKNTVPRFSVQIDEDFNHDLVINLSTEELLRDMVQQVVLLIHQKSHIHTTSYQECGTCDPRDHQSEIVNHRTVHGSADVNNSVTQGPDESLLKVHLPPDNRSVKGKSNLLLAISSFGYQILQYPHFAELCWFTSKLKEGPSADISGPWKGWPFNPCIVRPNNSIEKVAVACSSSNTKSKEKFGLVRGLIAVGLSAYRGVYTSLREVSFEIRKVLELLVAEVNSKIQAGKDRYQYVRLLSQVAYLEDVVNSWAYTLHSLELDAPMKMENARLTDVRHPKDDDVRPPDDHHVDGQVQTEEPKPNNTSKCSDKLEVPESVPQGFDTEKVGCVDLNKDGELGHPDSEGRLAISDLSGQKIVVMDSTLDKSLLGSNESLNDQNGTSPKPHESENDRNHVEVNGDSGSLKHSNGFDCTESVVISEDGSTSGEFGSIKLSSSRAICNEVNGLSSMEAGIILNNGKCDANEHIVGVDTSNKIFLPTKSGVLCLYRCCPTCLDTLRSLTHKLLIHKWGSNKSQWTIEDAHDIVASASVDLLSAIRRIVGSGGFSNSPDNKMRDRNSEEFKWPEAVTCHCKNSGTKSLLPVECKCHTISEDTSLNTHRRFDPKFIFRDGVLIHMDPDKDVSFHCKFETLCLCSLIELILMAEQPFH